LPLNPYRETFEIIRRNVDSVMLETFHRVFHLDRLARHLFSLHVRECAFLLEGICPLHVFQC
jgi:hypothetical protein